jgi:hypothetical protein
MYEGRAKGGEGIPGFLWPTQSRGVVLGGVHFSKAARAEQSALVRAAAAKAAAEAVGLADEMVKCTGLTQNSQVDPAVLTENPYKSLRVDPDSGSTLWISG